MTPVKKQLAYLRRGDPVLGAVTKKVPIPAYRSRRDYFADLVRMIANQQLSGKAAETILGRFVMLFQKPGSQKPRSRSKKFPTPQEVLAMPAARIRKAGLSRAKVAFIKDLAKKTLDGTLDLKRINRWPDEKVTEHLIEVKGIGKWTAEMFLMFSLKREDVFSYGDLGLRNAIKKLYGLRAHPTPRQAEKISAAWKPYRTLACLYLWASIDSVEK